MNTLQRILFAILVVMTIVLRLYKLNAPIADWHSFRQADTASVARIFAEHGIDLLRPRYHDLSNIQSGKDNPRGYRMVEVPLYQATSVLLYRMVPGISLEVSLRLVTVVSAAATTALIMLLVSSFGSYWAALASGFVYAVLPYSIFFGRTVLPETFAVFWALLSLVLLQAKVARAGNSMGTLFLTVLSAMCAAVSILVKPTAAFLLIPVPYLVFRAYGLSPAFVVRSVLFAAISLLPLYWWRGWISQFPEGIPAFDWLLNKGNIRFKGAWFQWLFAERLGKLMLGYWGLIPFGVGLLETPGKKDGWFYPLFTLGGLLYMAVFAAGNVQHDYYQIILLPPVAVLTGKGLVWLATRKDFSLVSRLAVLSAAMLFSIAFSWYTVRTYYWINRPEIIAAGAAADARLPKDAKVIAPYNGDTTFLYQTGRSGWPLGFDIDKKIAAGATHYVTVSPTDADFETKTLAQTYTVLVRNDTYAIIDLTKPRNK